MGPRHLVSRAVSVNPYLTGIQDKPTSNSSNLAKRRPGSEHRRRKKVDLRDCLRAVRRRWWLVAATVAATLGVATALVTLSVPQYATTMTFFVNTPGSGVADSYQGGLFSQQRVKSYAEVLVGDRLAKAVA